jgi:arylsulfatase A-like enzyme
MRGKAMMIDMKKPNVIWVFGDQMRAQAMSHRGDPNVSTPNMDRLASEGVSFSNAVAGTPLCTPFRGALITGRYPHRSTVPAHNHPISPDAQTVAHAFRENGYRTCWIGKWHLDGARLHELDWSKRENRDKYRIIPPERRGGFEDWWAYENNNEPFDCWVHTDRKDGTSESYRLPGYETDCLTDILIEWMKERVTNHKEQPFFASLSVQPPHDVVGNLYVAPEEYMEKHSPSSIELRPNVPPVKWVTDIARRDLPGYYAAIERLDWNLGRIRQALDELGIADNTYIVFFSDHGDLHGSHGQFRKTAPWEEAIRIPFIVDGPGRKHGRAANIDCPMNYVDIAPTTLGLCGIEKPEFMDGYDYSPLILKEFGLSMVKGDSIDDLPDSAFLTLPVPPGDPETVDRPFRGIVTRDGWKYIVLEGQPWLMFNLNDDPYEMVNLAHNSKFKTKRKLLHDRLVRWVTETEDQFLLPELD